MKTKKVLENLRSATEDMAKAFMAKYFPESVYGKDTFWVADEVGGVFFVSDFFFGVDRMVEALLFDASFEQLSNYYYAELEWGSSGQADKPFPVNFKNYVKYGMELPKIEGKINNAQAEEVRKT